MNLTVYFISSKDEELKRVIDLLKDRTSNRAMILEDLKNILNICLIFNLFKL